VATFPYTGFPDGTTYPVINLGSSTVNVSTSAALTTALANAAPGQRIVLANATYSGAFTLTSKAGTSANPISIEAATTGGAVFASGSTLIVKDCAYVTLKGLSFPFELSSGNILAFRGTSKYCRVTRCLFGPAALGTAGATKATYIYGGDSVEYIRVDHNELRFKTQPGNAILFDGNFTSFQACKHIRIDHNYVRNIGPEANNEKEPIRLGVSSMSKTYSYSVIERNRFEACIAEPEIVSVKASGCRVSGNTFYRCIGGPVYRHGTNGIMSDNYVVDDGFNASPGTSYRYYRLVVSALRDGTLANGMQLSEFALLSGSTRLTGMTITATNNSSPVGEEPTNAGDNSVTTKWFTFNKTASTLVYDFGSPPSATGYRWATANDSAERDPISWSVQGSNDGATWITLDTRTSYATTTSRSTYLPDFPFGG
jgi:chondroitinase B-like protein